MIKDIFNFLMIAGIILGSFFIVATSLSTKGKDKSIVYLNLVVLFLTINNLQICLVDNVYIEVNFFVRKLLLPWYVLIVPSFYTFIMYYLKVEKKIFSFVFISISLFVIELLFRIAFLPLYYHDNNNYIVAKYSQIEEIVNAIYAMFLFIKAFVLLFRYSKFYQYVLSFDNLKWLKNFMFLGSIVLLMWVCAIILNLDKVVNPDIYIYYPMRLSCSILLYWIGYQGFFNYSMMSERIHIRNAIVNTESKSNKIIFDNSQNESKDVKSNLTHSLEKEEQDDKFILINNYIKQNQRYLDPLFSLEILAAEKGMSVNKLSQIINQSNNFNFSDYINHFRVEEAKQFLISPEYSDYNIVSIGLECGFNSKSAFYNAFKKFTQMTPSEYKKENT
jgi:AraC-like DNA-binding protein